MGKRDERIDAYIRRSADFAKAPMNRFRSLVHQACPSVEETIKWGFPHFDYKGIMCSMAAFKSHCAFGFWKASLIRDPHHVMGKTGQGEGMGNFGKVTSLDDLPSDKILLTLIKDAARLNEEGIKALKKPTRKPTAIKTPAFLLKALKWNKKAQKVFSEFTPGHKREYIEWLTSAKTEETRQRRLATALEWLAEGKPMNWKYMKK